MTGSFKSKSYRTTDAYGHPEPLMRETAPALPYPTDALGSKLGPMAIAVQRATEAPMALCGSSVLASAALVVQPHVDIMIDGRVFPVSLDCLSVADSGERKTTVDKCCLAAIRNYEKELWKKYQQELETYEIESAIYRTEREAILKDKKKSGDARRTDLMALTDAVRPMRPHIIIEDTTIEALLRHLRNDRPSVGLFSAEGAMFLGGFSMRQEQLLATVAALSQLWDGRAVQRNTVTDFENTMPLYGRRLSCHLMLQPRVAMRILGSEEVQSQGLLSRFLICWPTSTIGTRFGKDTVRMDQSPDVALYNAMINKILERELPLSEDMPGELKPRQLTCSPESYGIWKQFNDRVEKRMAPDGDLFLLRNFTNKAGENAARIAGVLAIIEDFDAKNIAGGRMHDAVALMEFYLQEIVRAFCQGTVGDELQRAKTLLDWIIEKEHTYVYPALIYQGGPSMFRTKDRAMAALTVLEQHGHLMLMEEGFKVDEKPRQIAWKVVKETDSQEQEETKDED